MRGIARLAASLLLGVLTIVMPVQAQTAPPLGPTCSAPPVPADQDGWPKAITDTLLGATAGPRAIPATTLLANDIGNATLIVSAVAPTSSQGGTIVQSAPGIYTYTPAAAFVGDDVFTYEISQTVTVGSGTQIQSAVGLVKLTVAADVVAPTVSITSPTGGTVSGVITITASASDNVGVAGVTFFVDGTTQIGAEDTTSPYSVSWDSRLVADGNHSLTAVARDAAGNTATSAAVAVTVLNAVPPAPAVPTIAASAFSDGTGTRSVSLSTTAPGAVLIAVAASDGPTSGVNNQALTISGGGLAWTRVRRVVVQRGDAEIWTATAASALTNVTITSTQAVPTVLGLPANQSLMVLAFTGAAGVGASGAASGATGAPKVSLVTQGAGSAVVGVGIDFDRAVARTVPTGQTKLHEFLAPSGDTMWMQRLNGTTGAAGSTVTLNDTAPTTDQWNFASVEILSGAPPATIIVPNVVGMVSATAQSTITGASLTVGSITTASSTSVAAGSVISQDPAAGGSALAGSAVSLVVSTGAPPAVPTAQVTVFKDGAGAQTTAAFSTTGSTVLVAFAASDGPTPSEGPNTQSLTISGAGLTWTRIARAATSRGVSEIWTATAPAGLSNATVTSTQSVTLVLGLPVNQSLTVAAFTNASGIGASNIASGASGAPSVSLVAQAADSAVYAVGNDFDQAIARTVPAGQTKVHEFFAPSGDTMWVQRLNATTGAAGVSVTLNDTAPTADQWNFAIVEIKR